MIARQFYIRGLVQGVGYRFFTQRAAAKHQVLGYVRNLPDERVEIWAQADETAVEAFKLDLFAGSRASRVTEIEEIAVEPSKSYSSFRIEK